MKITKKLLEVNDYSRPTKPLHSTQAIVLHWFANPNSSALGVWRYFNDRKDGRNGYGSAHYLIDDDQIINCIPIHEVAYHVGSNRPIHPNSTQIYTDLAHEKFSKYCNSSTSPNFVTIGIELAHINWEGEFSKETLRKAEILCVNLCLRLDLNPLTDILTHHQIVGWKDCPRWFVDHPEQLNIFKRKISLKVKKLRRNLAR